MKLYKPVMLVGVYVKRLARVERIENFSFCKRLGGSSFFRNLDEISSFFSLFKIINLKYPVLFSQRVVLHTYVRMAAKSNNANVYLHSSTSSQDANLDSRRMSICNLWILLSRPADTQHLAKFGLSNCETFVSGQ